MNPPASSTIVIVGGVAGGASAATRARRMNEHAAIILFEKDEYVSFANCGLPYYVGGEIPLRDSLLVVKPELLQRRFRIDVRVRHEVTEINRSEKTVTVLDRDTGGSFIERYDKLILAPGADPVAPPIPGMKAANVFTLRNVPDADRIKSYLDDPAKTLPYVESTPPRRVVVVGAGYIGLEMIEQLAHRGVETALVELTDQVMPILDPEMARMVESELETHGVALHLKDGIRAIHTEGDRATKVELQSGTLLEADLVIVGIGVRPNVAMAQRAGIEIGPGGGIFVNEWMQTSDPDVYAVGDAVEYVFGPTGERLRVPLAGPANRAGRIAGEHAATGSATLSMAPVQGTAIARVFSVNAAVTGLSRKAAERSGKAAESVTIRAAHHVGYFPGARPMTVKLVFEKGTEKILGAQIVGHDGVDKRIDVIATALSFGGTVRDLAGLDLAYAPPYGAAKDPVHMAAFAACNVLDGLIGLRQPDEPVDDLQFVDVRTEAEVSAMPCRGTIWIPLDDLRDRLGELDPRRPTVVTCASGQRSYIAGRILKQHGFADVSNLTGGALVRRLACPEDFKT